MDRSPSLRPVLAEITVVAFEDPVVEHLGHRPGSAYIELVLSPRPRAIHDLAVAKVVSFGGCRTEHGRGRRRPGAQPGPG